MGFVKILLNAEAISKLEVCMRDPNVMEEFGLRGVNLLFKDFIVRQKEPVLFL